MNERAVGFPLRHLRASLACAVLLAGAAPSPARSEYRVQPGDVLDIHVAGVPDLQRKVSISVDGHVSLPWAGRVQVAGLQVSEMREAVQAALATKAVRQRNLEGREIVIFVGADEVSVDIADYRPVYLTGDVMKAGEQRYRPSMTVHQAISLAGGTDLARFRSTNPFMEAADFRAEYEAVSTEMAREQLKLWRLKAELANRTELDRNQAPSPSPGAPDTAPLRQLEAEHFEVRVADHRKEQDHLQRALKKAVEHLALLREQLQREGEGTQIDAKELETVQALYQRGMVPSTRVTDVRRSVLLSATRTLQTNVQIAQTAREQEEAGRKLQRLDDLRRTDLIREIQDVTVRLAVLRSRQGAASEKLLYTGAAQTLLMGGRGPKPQITVSRRVGEAWTRLAADLETEMQPGDVVEVVLKPDTVNGVPVQ